MKTEELKFEPILYLEQSFSESAHSLQMHLKIWIWQYWFTIFVTLTHTWKILHDAGQWGKGGTLLASKPSGGKVVYWLCKIKIRKTKQAIWGWGGQEPVLLLGKGIPDSLRRWTLHSWHACNTILWKLSRCLHHHYTSCQAVWAAPCQFSRPTCYFQVRRRTCLATPTFFGRRSKDTPGE